MKKELIGFDEHGQVYELEHTVYRTIQQEYKSTVADLYTIYLSDELFKKGIIETALLENGDLEHKKLTVSYPYEWTATMYKHAALFHVNLFVDLAKVALTLKDALPNNIVFSCTAAVFVDFLSLVRIDKLKNEAWLDVGQYGDPRFTVIDKMLLPYVVIPLLFMSRGEYGIAREMLSTRACNCGKKPPAWRELIRPGPTRNIVALKNYFKSLRMVTNILWARWQLKLGPAQFDNFIEKLGRLLQTVDVTPPRSGYSFYYPEKKEDIFFGYPSLFLPKQRSIYEILRAKKPKTVLDIGANTGWYSVLASHLGAEVISLEQDESCADILYERAKRNAYKILPLKLSFSELTKKIFGFRYVDRVSREKRFEENPLYRAGVERFSSELVLVLGLTHHLVLGEGYSIEELFEILRPLTIKTLVIEFIDIADDKISVESSFFRHINSHDVTTYNINRFIEIGRKHFAAVEIFDSNPNSRKILVFDK